MKKRIVTLIPQDEELTIRLLIASNKDLQIRLGLIKLCECYQKGQMLKSPQDVRDKLRFFIWEKRFPDRARWALKIIAEMRNYEDHDVILARLITPPDDPANHLENLAWTIIAFHAVANKDQIASVYEKKIISRDAVGLIAHELAEIGGQLPDNFPRIDIQKADDVLLKCACVCLATSRNLRGVFDPKFNQEEQLIALNNHHNGEVSQYSIYAMFRLQKMHFGHLGFKAHELPSKPVEVRRWSYRLMSKQRQTIKNNQDLFAEVIRTEASGDVLEGLALGLKEIWYDGIDIVITDWFQAQQDERVEMALLEHMARQSEKSQSYETIVIDYYRADTSSQLVKARLKEAAATTPLYGKLGKIDDTVRGGQHNLFVNLQNMGDINVTKNTQNFNGGRITIGVNAIGGNASTNTINQEINLNQEIMNLIDQLQKIANSDHGSSKNVDVSKALINLKQSPTKSTLLSAIESVKKWMAVGALSAEVVSFAKNFVDAASNIIK